jgi:tRNA1(Val) A37 N6-methylase TrmN6
MNTPAIAVEPGETLDRLAGDWWIFQLERGHRYATDDVLLAWAASRARPRARRLLDLGAGVGSVGLMVLLRADPGARLTSLELQPASVALLRKTVRYNGIEGRVAVRSGDLRQLGAAAPDERFDLITANPPYLRPDSASRSPDPQRAAARLELAGDVFDFCGAAARCLAPDGCLCLCHAAADQRPERAIVGAGLVVRSRQEVVFRAGQPPAIAIYTCGGDGPRRDRAPLVVRDEHGERTAAYRAVRREMLIEA